MSIRVVKLVTGEELLCDLVEQTETHVKVKDALLCVPQGQDQVTKKIQFGIMPYVSMAKENTVFNFKSQHVLYIEEADENAVSHHERVFSVIQTAPKGLVVAR